MCSKTHGQPFSETRDGRVEEFKRSFGFDPQLLEFEFETVSFDLQRVQQSLFDGTYRTPVTLPFRKEDAGESTPSVPISR